MGEFSQHHPQAFFLICMSTFYSIYAIWYYGTGQHKKPNPYENMPWDQAYLHLARGCLIVFWVLVGLFALAIPTGLCIGVLSRPEMKDMSIIGKVFFCMVVYGQALEILGGSAISFLVIWKIWKFISRDDD